MPRKEELGSIIPVYRSSGCHFGLVLAHNFYGSPRRLGTDGLLCYFNHLLKLYFNLVCHCIVSSHTGVLAVLHHMDDRPCCDSHWVGLLWLLDRAVCFGSTLRGLCIRQNRKVPSSEIIRSHSSASGFRIAQPERLGSSRHDDPNCPTSNTTGGESTGGWPRLLL